MVRHLKLLYLFLLLFGLGCLHAGPLGQPAAPEEAQAGPSYVIGQSDELEVQVWQEPDLSRTATVRGDGMISLPLVNEVAVEGLTLAQLRELLTNRYARVVADPVVSVMVNQPRSATFYVTGKVARPGEYPLLKRTTVLQAIVIAGGCTEWARTGSIALLRQGGQRLRIDYDDIVAGKTDGNVILQRGDTIVVP